MRRWRFAAVWTGIGPRVVTKNFDQQLCKRRIVSYEGHAIVDRIGRAIASKPGLHAFGPVFAVVAQRVMIEPTAVLFRLGKCHPQPLVERPICCRQGELMDHMGELVDQDVLCRIRIAWQTEQVLFATTDGGTLLGRTKAARTTIPVGRRRQVAVFGNIESELRRCHHRQTDPGGGDRLQQVITPVQHLPDEEVRFAQGVVADLARCENGHAATIEVFGVER